METEQGWADRRQVDAPILAPAGSAAASLSTVLLRPLSPPPHPSEPLQFPTSSDPSTERPSRTLSCKTPSSTPLPAISRPRSFNFLLLVLKLAVLDLCYARSQASAHALLQEARSPTHKARLLHLPPVNDLLIENSEVVQSLSTLDLAGYGSRGVGTF